MRGLLQPQPGTTSPLSRQGSCLPGGVISCKECALQDRARRSALREFLMERRARLKPDEVGLVSIGRRRVPGLRREEVAQLADISPAWYTLLETAHEIRVSPRMLDRLAQALRLNDRDKMYLFTLAIDELPTFPRTTVESVGSTGTEYSELRTFARRSRAASAIHELGELVTELLFDLMRPIEVSYFVEADLAVRTFVFTSQRVAPNVSLIPHERFGFSAVHDAEEVLVDGGLFGEHNLIASPHALFRERARALGSGRYLSQGVKGRSFDGAIGYIQPSREPHTDRDRQILALIAEIMHLALASRT